MKKSDKRWKLAQSYEKDWWFNKSEDLDLEFYERFAGEVEKLLQPFIIINNDKYVLEIGSGAAGIITYVNSDFKFAIDPLEDFYSTIPKFTSIRDKRVNYSNAMAEEIPFDSEYFDLIIIDNVLDHCKDPDRVISEMRRVLKPGGIIYFRQNTYHCWGKAIRHIMEMLKIDKGHPYTFLKKDLNKKFLNTKFKTLLFVKSGYFKTWKKEITSKRLYDKIKGLLLVNRDKVTYILKKVD